MVVNTEGLSHRQLLTISKIISSSTFEEAYKRAKISKTTLYSWLKEDDFKAELKRQRDEVINEALSRLKCAVSKATEVMIKLMDSPREDIQRLACKDILEYALKSIELENIEQRIDKVERMTLEKVSYR